MSAPSRRSLTAALLAAVLLAPVVGGVAVDSTTAAPPPEELCGVCGDEFSTVAPQEGVPLNVERSTLNISVDRSGTGHWHARVAVTPSAAERLAENDTLRDHVVGAVYESGRTVVDDPRNLSTRVENETLVVDFDVPDVARRGPGDVVLVTLLDRSDDRSGLTLDADRIGIRGPNGSVVTRGVGGATTDGDTVTWERSVDGHGLWIPRDALIAFAPGDGFVGTVTTWTALLGYAGSRLSAAALALVASATLTLGAAGAVLFDSRNGEKRRSTGTDGGTAQLATQGVRRLGLTLAVTGIATAVLLAVASVVVGIRPAVLVAGAAVVAAFGAAATLDRELTLRRLGGWAVVAVGVANLVALAVAGGSGDARVLAFAAPLALFCPAGYADLRSGWSLPSVVAALLALPMVIALAFLFLVGVGAPALGVAALVGWAGVALALGLPLLVLGRRLARD